MEIIANRAVSGLKSLASFTSVKALWQYADLHVTAYRKAERDSIWKSFVDMEQGKNVTEHRFMREYVWCVHVSGFSAKVVSRLIDKLLVAHQIEAPDGSYIVISDSNLLGPDRIAVNVYPVNKNKAKAKAIQAVRKKIFEAGWLKFAEQHLGAGPLPQDLQRLPFLGPALSCHMARNLGNLNVAKPDVHLTRLANKLGLSTVDSLCRACLVAMSPAGQDVHLGGHNYVGYVDLVLWLASVDCGTR